MLRLLRMLLAGYLFTTLCAKFMLNLGVGKPPSIGLRPKDMPAGQRLRLKSRRRSEGGLCKGYSAVEDPYFVPYGKHTPLFTIPAPHPHPSGRPVILRWLRLAHPAPPLGRVCRCCSRQKGATTAAQ